MAQYYRYPTEQEFDALVVWCEKMGYAFVGLEDYLADDNRKKILVTFDDGFKIVKEILHPYMMRRQLPYMLFVLTDPLANPAFTIPTIKTNDTTAMFLSKAEILELKAQGVHIGFHTRNHTKILGSDRLTDESIKDQLTFPKEHDELFSKPLCFAYPYLAPENYGLFDNFMSDVLGYRYFFDTKGFRNSKGNHFFRVSIDIEKNVTRKNWIKFGIKRQWLSSLKQRSG
ncbi:Polysaccharide deacetylase [Chryseolinea serpens]|uniref:Polysaccharide deacetylase n=1 Tax=Chryseolinea serpens TaxID=947013 RepID=A0A1M5NSN3_9BACT|nr:Polysaccharide deacetylase [Chryseolinea serpens]